MERALFKIAINHLPNHANEEMIHCTWREVKMQNDKTQELWLGKKTPSLPVP